ncbi:S8 family serine peptidase [Bradyrhizobium sp. LA6.12]|uniref:S8 family serine peptidase n=1 Tax=unclassified Bradyrhizobium TaxID=2631580 RepID=UPI003398712C
MTGRAHIFFGEAEEGRLSEALRDIPSDRLAWFKGYVEADIGPERAAALRAQGFDVATDEAQPAAANTVQATAVATASARAQAQFTRPSKRNDPQLMARFAKMSAGVTDRQNTTCYRFALDGPLTQERRQQLAQLDVRILNYRRGFYQVYLDDMQRAKLEGLPFVTTVRRYDLLDSVSTGLLTLLQSRDGAAATGRGSDDGPGRFDALTHEASEAQGLAETLRRDFGLHVLGTGECLVRFEAAFNDDLLARIAGLPQVRMLTPSPEARLACDRLRGLIGVDRLGPDADSVGRAWTGAGELVAVLDSGIKPDHPDFGGPPGTIGTRLRDLVSYDGCSEIDIDGHGTHVAGIIAGTGAASNGEIRGIAPGAELVVIGIVRDNGALALPVELADLLAEARQRGASIVNCSWAKPLGSTYDTGSLSFDRFVHEHPETLVVVAAGNEATASNGQRSFWNVGSPATAKNVLTVGACGTDRTNFTKTWAEYDSVRFPLPAGSHPLAPATDEVALLSSAGPTDNDGVKPDLVAPGTYILSTRIDAPNAFRRWEETAIHGNHYIYLQGTSMAAPAVTGAAAVLRQYLRERHQIAHPSAALMKALLITATRPIAPCERPGAPEIGYPDFDQGFGRLDLRTIVPGPELPAGRTIAMIEVANEAGDALESGLALGAPGFSVHRYRMRLAAEAAGDLVVTLCWTDAPGNGVQNDLQLALLKPNGEQIVGNPDHRYGRGFAPPDSGAGGAITDRRNTVEQIRLRTPEAGSYTVRVWARNTVYPRQGYGLVVCGAIAEAPSRMN